MKRVYLAASLIMVSVSSLVAVQSGAPTHPQPEQKKVLSKQEEDRLHEKMIKLYDFVHQQKLTSLKESHEKNLKDKFKDHNEENLANTLKNLGEMKLKDFALDMAIDLVEELPMFQKVSNPQKRKLGAFVFTGSVYKNIIEQSFYDDNFTHLDFEEANKKSNGGLTKAGFKSKEEWNEARSLLPTISTLLKEPITEKNFQPYFAKKRSLIEEGYRKELESVNKDYEIIQKKIREDLNMLSHQEISIILSDDDLPTILKKLNEAESARHGEVAAKKKEVSQADLKAQLQKDREAALQVQEKLRKRDEENKAKQGHR